MKGRKHMALIAIACPSCGHRGVVGTAKLPRKLKCVACGQAHRFERVLPPVTEGEQSTPHRTRGQRIAAIAAHELKAAARRQREHADDLT